MTDHERKARTAKIREKRLKEVELKNKQLEKENKDLQNVSKQYPPFILTLLKKLKRIDPFNTVCGLTPINCAIISYFKLRQTLKFDKENIRIQYNSRHCWVEFNYNDKWWVFDPKAVSNLKLGNPIKSKNHSDHDYYNFMSRSYTDINDFYEEFESKIDYTIDEAKIAAMQDSGLSTVLKINYH